MDTKYIVIMAACVIGGLAGGYLIANNLMQNQLTAYNLARAGKSGCYHG